MILKGECVDRRWHAPKLKVLFLSVGGLGASILFSYRPPFCLSIFSVLGGHCQVRGAKFINKSKYKIDEMHRGLWGQHLVILYCFLMINVLAPCTRRFDESKTLPLSCRSRPQFLPFKVAGYGLFLVSPLWMAGIEDCVKAWPRLEDHVLAAIVPCRHSKTAASSFSFFLWAAVFVRRLRDSFSRRVTGR